jgi:hypothetical protein
MCSVMKGVAFPGKDRAPGETFAFAVGHARPLPRELAPRGVFFLRLAIEDAVRWSATAMAELTTPSTATTTNSSAGVLTSPRRRSLGMGCSKTRWSERPGS